MTTTAAHEGPTGADRSASAAPPTPPPAAGRRERLARLAHAHRYVVAVLVAAVLLRVSMHIAYPYAFFGGDTRPYVAYSTYLTPYTIRPYGYSMFLKPFVPGPMILVAAAQHLMILALIVVGYVFLTARGVPRWLAALAFVPVALDARHATLEHYVLAETLYTTLTAVGLMLLAWRRPGTGWRTPLPTRVALLAGAVLTTAALTRTIGVPVLVLAGGYLLLRWPGWRPVLAFGLVTAVLLGGYATWYNAAHGVFALGQFQGRFLYARVMTIAECDRLELTERQRTLCVDTPPEQRPQRNDRYVWVIRLSPARALYWGTGNDEFLGDFAKTVIRQQPGDYARMVARETGWHLAWRPPLEEDQLCLREHWLPPERPGADCGPTMYTPTPGALVSPERRPFPATAWTSAMHGYGRVATTPGPLVAACVLFALFAAVWRWRRPGWRDAGDALLFAGTGLGVIVLSVATSMFETRYAVPAVYLVPVAAVLAAHRLRQTRRPQE
ncbi:MAG TPA: hypothetical protein VES42_14300 [Pilimelia sp.]|nr:hypothetical protein [Pilimelia sp.]